MNLKKWTLLVAMMGVLLTTAFAGDGNGFNDFRAERWKYFQENIKPKIDAQRSKLESSLSSADKKEIAKLRESMISERLMLNELMGEAHANRIKGEAPDEGLFTEIRAQRIVIENLHDQAKVIANKYRPQIDDLLAVLQADKATWRQGMRKQAPEGRQFNGPQGRGQRQQGHGAFGQQGHHGPKGMAKGPFPGTGGRHDLGVVGFLLWDVNRG